VLIVDDHLDSAELLQVLLGRRGFEVSVALSVETAVDAAGDAAFDVLVSDIELPDGSGCDLLPRLRAGAHIAAIALSGLSRDADVQRCMEAGFDEHLVKPVGVDSLVDAIERVRRG
jgi:DNA-binding response OmpR family regulator